MRRKPHYIDVPPHIQPGLFDSLDEFATAGDRDEFQIIPPEKIKELKRLSSKADTGRNSSSRAPIAEMELPEATDHIFFMSFGSGSSGNCSYVGDRRSGFLIDAGIDARRVLQTLERNGIMPEQIKGIILTHDHHDHISQAYPLLRAIRNIKLYCTPRTLNGILRHRNVSRRIKDYHVPVYKEFPFNIGAFTITPFEVSHDSSDNAGFFIEHGSETMAVATDLGCITPRVDFYMRQAQSIVIESNYDLESLMTGSYADYLKARILARTGHLDNTITAAFISEIYTTSLRNVFLCHLSHDNNTPDKALAAMMERMAAHGIQHFESTTISSTAERSAEPALAVIPLPRYDNTPLFTL